MNSSASTFTPASPPFIADQRLFLLDDSHTSARKSHDAIKNKFGHRRYLDQEDDETNAGSLPWEQRPWGQVASRLDFILDRSIQHLCVMSDAGRGKSSLLEQMEYILNGHSGCHRHLAVRIEFRQIPPDPAEIVNDLLVIAIAKRFGPLEDYRGVARHLLGQQLQRGELTILVDALDQIDQRRDASVSSNDRARSLANFVKTHPQVRVVVSGRPSSILDQWEMLFGDSDATGSGAIPWRFVQIDEFTKEQTQTYLGHRWPFVQQLDAETLAVPRALEQVFQLESDELRQIRTRGELYWYCLDKSFDKAIEKQQADLKSSKARFLLALLAIECVKNERFQSLEGDDYIQFRRQLWQSRQQEIRDELEEPKFKASQLDDMLYDLASLNHHLDPGVIKEGCSANSPGEMVRLCWHNNTTLCFYAAYWMVRFATNPADLAWMHENIFLDADMRQDDPLYEFWRFLVELPGADFPLASSHSAVRKDLIYARSVAVLFQREDGQRSTEMMWRAWPDLLRLVDRKLSRDSSEDAIEKSSWALARDVHASVDAGTTALPFDGHSTASGVAKLAFWSFFREFPGLCREDTDRGRVARILQCHGDSTEVQNAYRGPNEPRYVLCPPAGTTSTFVMGSPDGTFIPPGASAPWPAEEDRWNDEHPHVETLTPAESFWLRDFVVTNAELELFLPSHKTDRSMYSKSDDHPAVNVSWYEATLFCRWLGAGFRLPTEREWECACRAIEKFDPEVPHPRHWYSDDASHELMNFGFNQEGATVRGEFPQPNAWDLYDMLGNVREWCSDVYRKDTKGETPASETEHANSSDRVLRGGSWSLYPLSARCALRNWSAPGSRGIDAGFRLSRTP